MGAAGLEPAKSRGDASFTGWCDCRSATHPKQNPPYGTRTRSTTVTGWRADPYTYGSREVAKIAKGSPGNRTRAHDVHSVGCCHYTMATNSNKLSVASS